MRKYLLYVAIFFSMVSFIGNEFSAEKSTKDHENGAEIAPPKDCSVLVNTLQNLNTCTDIEPISATATSGNASFAFDGNENTRWESDFADPQSITMELDTIYEINQVTIHWEAANAKDYTLKGSTDGIIWDDIMVKTNMPQGDRTDTISNINGSYRFIQMMGTERNMPYGYSIWEMNVCSTAIVSNENDACIEPASATATSGNASFAIDGNEGTRWESDFTDPQSLTLDLDTIYEVNQVTIHWEAANAKNYTLKGSTDGINWNDIITKTNMPEGDRTDTINNINANYRYIQMLGTERNLAYGYSIWEMNVCSSIVEPDYIYENGSWSPEDPALSATSTDNILISNGTITFSQPIECNNLNIDTSATLNVSNVLHLYGDLTNNGNLIFTSTATSNGELATVPATSTITGNVTVERYMSAQRSYRMLSSSVTTTSTIHDNWQEGAVSFTDNPANGYGTHITGTLTDQVNGFDYTPSGNPSMFTLDVANQQFSAIGNTDVHTLNAGDPYLLFVRGDRSTDVTVNNATPTETILRSTGSLHTGNQLQNFTVSDANDFVMFGNPYLASVDVFSVLGNSTNVNTSQYYVYDPTLADHGSYVAVMSSGGNSVPGSEANEYLQPGQGAQVAAVNGGGVSILFQESDKAVDNHTATHRPDNNSTETAKITAALYQTEKYVNGGKAQDGFLVLFSNDYSNSFTQKDAIKPLNFDENIGISSNSKLLSIEQRSMPVEGEVIQLFNNGYQYESYTLVLQVENLNDVTAYFRDSYTDKDIELSNGENILNLQVNTDSSESLDENRFSIFFAESTMATKSSDKFLLSLYPNPTEGDSFQIKSTYLSDTTVKVEINDMLGRQVYADKKTFTGNTLTISTGNRLTNGVYFVSVEHQGHKESRRIIKQ